MSRNERSSVCIPVPRQYTVLKERNATNGMELVSITTFTLRTVCQNRSRTVHRTVLKRVHTYTNRTGSQRKKGRSEYICACAMYSIISVENGSEKPSFFYCFGNLHEDIFVSSRPLKHCLNAVFPPDFNQYESFFVTPCTTSHGSTNSSCNSQAKAT